MQHSALKKYKITSHIGDNLQHIILLYEGIIRLLKAAKDAAMNKKFEEKFHIIDKISQIINGLNASINDKKGGEISLILHQFYDFCYIKLFSIKSNDDLSIFDELENHFNIMLNGWKEAIKQQSNNDIQNNFLA